MDIRVIDPSCGSGHFLLAAARRIAEKLALTRAHDEIVTPANYRLALRDVIQHCIYGVDLNPLAVELARMALWLEGFAEGMPLSFLDHHLKVGNSLLGVFDLSVLNKGIADVAYTASGQDSKAICEALRQVNKIERKGLNKTRELDIQSLDLFQRELDSVYLKQIESSHSSDLAGEISKEALYKKYLEAFSQNNVKQACDLLIAAYLSEKSDKTRDKVPTTAVVSRTYLYPEQLLPQDSLEIHFAQEVCANAHVFHWPLEFPQVFASGGFDCILGNPPWEKATLEDKQWFANRQPIIANAKNGAEREEMVKALSEGCFAVRYLNVSYSQKLCEEEKKLYVLYKRAEHRSAAQGHYLHLSESEGGQFPMTGVGITNLYAYFSELALKLRKQDGTIGIVVPTGIITDDTTKAYSQYILDGHTQSLYHFNNTEKLFPIDSRYSFVLITLRDTEQTDCVFYASNLEHLEDPQRHVVFEKGDLQLFSPNTKTCVLMRSKRDLEICRKIYHAAPVLIKEEDEQSGNPWGIRFMQMFNMTTKSHLFRSEYHEGYVPLYEGKLFHQFDNRWATFDKVNAKGEPVERDVTQTEKEDSTYKIQPRYWVDAQEVSARFIDRKTGASWWNEPWMFALRNITRATDERTVICSVLPSKLGLGHSASVLCSKRGEAYRVCLCANLNSLIVEFVARLKQSGANLNNFIVKQLPVLPPSLYSKEDVAYIKERVAKLTRTNDEINKLWLTEYPTYKFQKPEERLQIRAELDAYYAHLYGLTRDELRYILDPSDVMGKDFHSVTFPGLKANEKKKFGEYLTQRLVLEAYDNLVKTERFSNKSDT
ncbi:MAG TPA: N-6 DNA methylase [Candidatus Aphodousia faecavium]|nr:N-6 DNA methylase [Candidatus Aphodousia faecavium]